MVLSDAELTEAGNAALRLVDLPELAEAGTAEDGFVFVSTRLPGGERLVGSNGIWLDSTPTDAAVAFLDGLTNDISETSTFWGLAFPRCPGHLHPATYRRGEEWIALSCPQTGAEIRRVTV